MKTRWLIDVYKVEIPDNGKCCDDLVEATEDWLNKYTKNRCYQFQVQGNTLNEIGKELAKKSY